jgi:hypothetical protein
MVNKVNTVSYTHEARMVFRFNDMILWAKVSPKGELQFRVSNVIYTNLLMNNIDQ